MKRFLGWLKLKCKEASTASGKAYYPGNKPCSIAIMCFEMHFSTVLVAHMGYRFFFKVLVSEMHRHHIDRMCFDNIA